MAQIPFLLQFPRSRVDWVTLTGNQQCVFLFLVHFLARNESSWGVFGPADDYHVLHFLNTYTDFSRGSKPIFQLLPLFKMKMLRHFHLFKRHKHEAVEPHTQSDLIGRCQIYPNITQKICSGRKIGGKQVSLEEKRRKQVTNGDFPFFSLEKQRVKRFHQLNPFS